MGKFWASVTYHALSITRPEEKGRAVVNIDSRCHVNNADSEIANKDDMFTITSSKTASATQAKSYTLQLSSSTTKSANFNLQLAGAGFFNMAASLVPKGGISGSYSKTTSETLTAMNAKSASLSQGYQINDTLSVPPKTMVKAQITTWAVTYESTSVTEVTVDAKAKLPVRYRTLLSRRLGGLYVSEVEISAKELFRNEWDYKCENEVVTFKRKGKVSYLGEEVEIIKDT